MRNITALIIIILMLLTAFGCKDKKTASVYTSTMEGVSILVPSPTGGIVNELLVSEGDWVEAGDTLAVMDSRELHYQMDQLDASLKELGIQKKIAKSTLDQTQRDLSHATEYTERLNSIYEVNGISRQNIDDANNMLAKSKTLVTNTNDQFAVLAANEDKILSQKKILLKKMNDCILKAPSAGMISSLYFQLGEAITPYGNLCELVNTKLLDTKVYVSEQVLNNIKIGQNAQLLTANGAKYTGKVVYISAKAEFTPKSILTPDTRSAMVYAVKIRVANPEGSLKIGMPVDITL